ncbi:cytochrome P450 [Mycena rosella]|uniref:Cytochrome P450 n=1 Tax=Mycena rosella TaxID=1033263 RepID=A0AAD7CDI2_MYCRO|nr:cytochrome P450 [Mycena rosella]
MYNGRVCFDMDAEEVKLAKLAKGPGKKNYVTSMLCEKLREITGKPTLNIEQQEFLDLNVNYTASNFIRGQIISLIPVIFKLIFGPLISTRKSTVRHALKFLGPMIDERLEKEGEYGREWPGRPASRLLFLRRHCRSQTHRTTSYRGCSTSPKAKSGRPRPSRCAFLRPTWPRSIPRPQLIFPLTLLLREADEPTVLDLDRGALRSHHLPGAHSPHAGEAERVIAEEGWPKALLANMHKIDSFLCESQRLTAADAISMSRKIVATDGFTFSDGITIPRGSFISVPGTTIHYDPDNYEHAAVFDGFRFPRLREQRGGPASSGDKPNEGTGFFNRHMVSTAPDHIVFGHGRHACPGCRFTIDAGSFFAVTELKAMLAYMLMNYDVKAMTEGIRPPDDCFGVMRMPNSRGKIMIRKRFIIGSLSSTRLSVYLSGRHVRDFVKQYYKYNGDPIQPGAVGDG